MAMISKTAIALITGLLLSLFTVVSAGQVEPLLLKGKRHLYQRVVTRPGAMLEARPGHDQDAHKAPAFSIYYVYSRKQLGQTEWLQVGDNTTGKHLAWVRGSQTIPWQRGLTVLFRNPLGQERALFFRDEKTLKSLVEKGDRKTYENYYHQAVEGKLGADSPVVAIQPDDYIDPARQFYLAPILQSEDVFFGEGQAKLLRVATVTEQSAAGQPVVEETTADDAKTADAAKPYTVGVVFVVDATLSMGPYIDRTRQAIHKLYDALKQQDSSGQMRFGLVAFRDNTEAVPALDYVVRRFATLAQGADANQFFAAVDQVAPATVSSQDFREDAYAGIREALEHTDWKGVDGRYVILVTDAGPRGAHDPLGSTGLSADTLNKLAQRQHISLTVLHLLTPQGAANHAEAADRYRHLSRYPGLGSLYYGVTAGDLQQFGQAVDTVAQQIGLSIETAMKAQPGAPDGKASLEALKGKISRIGHAMKIHYLAAGKKKVPDLVDAWVLDRSFSDPGRKTLDVGVLMTRDQLSDLHQRLTALLASFEDGLLQPENFINDIKQVAATLTRDPDKLKAVADKDLASVGLMREYLEDLPYQSEAMSISLEDWKRWPVARQLRFIHRLQEKLAYYQALYDHPDMWYSPDGQPVNGESVIALSLDMLP